MDIQPPIAYVPAMPNPEAPIVLFVTRSRRAELQALARSQTAVP